MKSAMRACSFFNRSAMAAGSTLHKRTSARSRCWQTSPGAVAPAFLMRSKVVVQAPIFCRTRRAFRNISTSPTDAAMAARKKKHAKRKSQDTSVW